LAEKRLSADTVNFSSSISSVKKGEVLKDTIRNIAAMNIDMVVVRHRSAGVPLFLTTCVDAAIINAGDGMHEHPTQSLLDLLTAREKMGKLEGLKVAIIGDITHSRVARSNIYGFTRMGSKVMLCGPQTLMPMDVRTLGVDVTQNLDEAIDWADVVYVLRIQLERQASGLFPSIREYHAEYGVTLDRLRRIGKKVLIMHPGPINRGVELDSNVADSEFSVILDQVTNGVAVRMAILYLLSGLEETGV
jgi:aspartate carbamoyltransferase catalytic subunit